MRQQPKLWDCQRERKRTSLWKANAQPGLLTEQRIEWIPRESLLTAYRIHSPPEAERQASDSRSWKARDCCNLDLRLASSTKLWAGSQLLTMSSWDPKQLTSARRVGAWDQLSRGDMAHRGKWAAETGEVIKTHGPPGTVCLPSTWLPELLGPGKGTKHKPNRVCALVGCPRTWAV